MVYPIERSTIRWFFGGFIQTGQEVRGDNFTIRSDLPTDTALPNYIHPFRCVKGFLAGFTDI